MTSEFFARIFIERKPIQNPSWWYVLVPWPVILLLIVGQSYLAYQDGLISTRERTIAAYVNSIETGNHASSKYTFAVNGRSYSGWGYPEGFRQGVKFHIGEQILVHYDPQNPSENSMQDYQSQSIGNYQMIPFYLLILAAFPAWVFFMRRRHKRMLSRHND